MKKILNKLRFRRTQNIIRKKDYKLKECLLIFGEPRSGTTWLMELLSDYNSSFCINWEPLHVKEGPIDRAHNLGWYPFIKEDEYEEFESIFREVLTTKRYNEWTLKFNDSKRATDSKYVLTKFVRANLLIPFLSSNFDFVNKPILLLRHPIPTMLSQLKAFEPDLETLKTIDIPDVRNNDRFVKHHEYLQSLKTNLEIKIAYWCINNMATLKNSEAMSKLEVLYYEDLIMNGEGEVKKLMTNWSYQFNNEELLSNMNFKKRSSTDFNKDLLESKAQLEKGIEQLSKEELKSIQAIFDYFEFDIYAADNPLPQNRLEF